MRNVSGLPVEFTVATRQHTCFVDITRRVQRCLDALDDVRTATSAVIFVPHTTAGITINENADPDVMADIEATLERLVPWRNNYRHSEGNSAAHIKSLLTGTSVTIPLRQGRLVLGTWQGIYFCEFDGPRRRSVFVTLGT
ncbi:MAG: secondary thiamine-phosphate synthase enzyme YjbQ [Kiritimatiellia bacterium]|jgi:secondary thiamine-phosphate synthase enzyme